MEKIEITQQDLLLWNWEDFPILREKLKAKDEKTIGWRGGAMMHTRRVLLEYFIFSVEGETVERAGKATGVKTQKRIFTRDLLAY